MEQENRTIEPHLRPGADGPSPPGDGPYHEADRPLPLAEILCSLSHALDLTEGRPMGHAQRTCLIGMRIAAELGLPEADQGSLFRALLLKDVGCASNAARIYALFGDDGIAPRHAADVYDWDGLFEAGRYAVDHALGGHSVWARLLRSSLGPTLRRLGATARPSAAHALREARGARGAQIATGLGLGEETAGCIRCLDERWDGRGSPLSRRGDGIPLLARIASLAQTLEVFSSTYGVAVAYEVARRRSGTWFDPALVCAARSFRRESLFWRFVREAPRERVLGLELGAAVEVATDSRIDLVCDTFAQVVDAKSPYTAEHSSRVCAYSVGMATAMGIGGARLSTLRRAALLHDIGKLSIPARTLNKPGRLTGGEWERMRQHPRHSEEILGGITGFGRLARIAGAHHERLDGTGYFRGLKGNELDMDMRILAVADVFDALLAARPYRPAMAPDEALEILARDAGVGLDGRCIDVLRQKYAAAPVSSLPAPAAEHLLAA